MGAHNIAVCLCSGYAGSNSECLIHSGKTVTSIRQLASEDSNPLSAEEPPFKVGKPAHHTVSLEDGETRRPVLKLDGQEIDYKGISIDLSNRGFEATVTITLSAKVVANLKTPNVELDEVFP
jgi:hypothetical protein